MLGVPDVDFIMPCGVVVFALFYGHLCYVGCLQYECVPIYASVCFVCFILCLTLLVNCLLNVSAICVGEVSVFSLKVMVLLLGCGGVLLASPCIVFQRVCVVFVIPVCV